MAPTPDGDGDGNAISAHPLIGKDNDKRSTAHPRSPLRAARESPSLDLIPNVTSDAQLLMSVQQDRRTKNRTKKKKF